MAIALPVVAALFISAAESVMNVQPNANHLVPSCWAISTSVAPSRNVTAPAEVVVCTPKLARFLACDIIFP